MPINIYDGTYATRIMLDLIVAKRPAMPVCRHAKTSVRRSIYALFLIDSCHRIMVHPQASSNVYCMGVQIPAKYKYCCNKKRQGAAGQTRRDSLAAQFVYLYTGILLKRIMPYMKCLVKISRWIFLFHTEVLV